MTTIICRNLSDQTGVFRLVRDPRGSIVLAAGMVSVPKFSASFDLAAVYDQNTDDVHMVDELGESVSEIVSFIRNQTAYVELQAETPSNPFLLAAVKSEIHKITSG